MKTTVQVYARLADIPMEKLMSESRKEEITEKRRAIWYKLKLEDGLSNKQIARIFHKKSHSTVVSGINKVKALISVRDKRTQKILDALQCDYSAYSMRT